MDVMSLLSGTSPTATIVERSSLPKVLNLPVCGSLYTYFRAHIHCISQKYDRLSDWVEVVKEFRSTAPERANVFRCVLVVGFASLGARRSDQPLALFRWRRCNAKITSNFLSAAVHVAFLNTGVCRNKFAELPDTGIALFNM